MRVGRERFRVGALAVLAHDEGAVEADGGGVGVDHALHQRVQGAAGVGAGDLAAQHRVLRRQLAAQADRDIGVKPRGRLGVARRRGRQIRLERIGQAHHVPATIWRAPAGIAAKLLDAAGGHDGAQSRQLLPAPAWFRARRPGGPEGRPPAARPGRSTRSRSAAPRPAGRTPCAAGSLPVASMSRLISFSGSCEDAAVDLALGWPGAPAASRNAPPGATPPAPAQPPSAQAAKSPLQIIARMPAP